MDADATCILDQHHLTLLLPLYEGSDRGRRLSSVVEEALGGTAGLIGMKEEVVASNASDECRVATPGEGMDGVVDRKGGGESEVAVECCRGGGVRLEGVEEELLSLVGEAEEERRGGGGGGGEG